MAGAFEPGAFSFDGCTGWIDGTWQVCCLEHDIQYWVQDVTRLASDIELLQCVGTVGGGSAMMAAIMYFGVRIFGWWLWLRGVRGTRESVKKDLAG